jgi:hypothetical protein
LTLAYLRNSETYADLACGSRIGTTTVYRYVREPLDLRAARAPRLAEAIEVARGKAKAPVVLDGTLLRIDRLGMTGGRYRPYYSGKHKCHGVNVQVIADPAGHLTWTLAALPGARHDMGAAREHGITDAIADAGVPAVADTAYQGSGPAVRPRNGVDAPTPTPAATDDLSLHQKDVNTAHARQRGPGERPTPRSRTGRSSARSAPAPSRATTLGNAVQTLILAAHRRLKGSIWPQ